MAEDLDLQCSQNIVFQLYLAQTDQSSSRAVSLLQLELLVFILARTDTQTD